MFNDYSISDDVNLNFSQNDVDFSYYNNSIKEKSIEELAAENVVLKSKLLANLQVLREKKTRDLHSFRNCYCSLLLL